MIYVIATGNAFEGVTLYGPFDSATDAQEWAEANFADWTIVPLSPTVELKRPIGA